MTIRSRRRSGCRCTRRSNAPIPCIGARRRRSNGDDRAARRSRNSSLGFLVRMRRRCLRGLRRAPLDHGLSTEFVDAGRAGRRGGRRRGAVRLGCVRRLRHGARARPSPVCAISEPVMLSSSVLRALRDNSSVGRAQPCQKVGVAGSSPVSRSLKGTGSEVGRSKIDGGEAAAASKPLAFRSAALSIFHLRASIWLTRRDGETG